MPTNDPTPPAAGVDVEACDGPFCRACGAREPHLANVCVRVLRQRLTDEQAEVRALRAKVAEQASARMVEAHGVNVPFPTEPAGAACWACQGMAPFLAALLDNEATANAEITNLRAQLATAEAHGRGIEAALLKANQQWTAEVDTARAERDAMREAVKARLVSGHSRGCAAKSFDPGPCDCGHHALERALTAAGEG